MANADLSSRVAVLDAAYEAGELTDVVKDPRQGFLDSVSSYGPDAQQFAKAMQAKSKGGECHTIQSVYWPFYMYTRLCVVE